MIDFKILMEVVPLLIGIAGVYWKLQVSFDRHEKEDQRELAAQKEENDKFDKYASEFFDRIKQLEIQHASQLEINKNLGENWKRIEDKLNNIEGLLRNRRSSDQ